VVHYYIIGKIVRANENGTVVIYLSDPNRNPTIFAGFAFTGRLELLLAGAVELVDLFMCCESLLDARIEVPKDILEFNLKNQGVPSP
jgi:hypothetical protein